MKKRLAAIAALAMITAGVGTMVAAPAQADVVSCVAQGTATLSGGLGLPVLTSNSVTFNLSSNVAVCSNLGLSVTASGSLAGACGLSSGSGTVSLGGSSHGFTYQSAATVLVLGANGGGVVGVVNAFADPTVANNSCASGTAHTFQVQGTVASTS